MFRKILNTFLALTLVLSSSALSAYADDESTTFPFLFSEQEEAEFTVDQEKIEENQNFMNRVEKELQNSKVNYRQILNNINDNEYQLELIKEQKIDLESQIENIDRLIDDSEERFALISGELTRLENEVELLKKDISVTEVAIAYQEDILSEYLRLIYIEDSSLDPYSLLLSSDSVAENFDQIKYIDLLNITGMQILDALDEMSMDLQTKEALLADKKVELKSLYNAVKIEKDSLKDQKEAKTRFLAATEGKEEIYQQLLKSSREEQENALSDVQVLSQSFAMIAQEFEEKGENFNYEDYLSVLTDREKSLFEFQAKYRGVGSKDFAWPLDPFKGISAYFRDPGYAGAFKVRHNAIDIPAYQGSFVHAAQDGVVYTAKDNGYGYSYIVLAHADGFSTVYGHISDIMVSEGDIVARGTVIGLSGGMPGTKGAGYMTTGPHLHFEMLKDGDYIDPLYYLPLEVLTKDQMEWLPQKYKDIWNLDVSRVKAEKGITVKRVSDEDEVLVE